MPDTAASFNFRASLAGFTNTKFKIYYLLTDFMCSNKDSKHQTNLIQTFKSTSSLYNLLPTHQPSNTKFTIFYSFLYLPSFFFPFSFLLSIGFVTSRLVYTFANKYYLFLNFFSIKISKKNLTLLKKFHLNVISIIVPKNNFCISKICFSTCVCIDDLQSQIASQSFEPHTQHLNNSLKNNK